MARCVLLTCLLTGCLFLPALGAAPAPAASPVLVLDAGALSASQRQLAASLQGLANRAAEGPRVFVLTRPGDDAWLGYALHLEPRPVQRVTVEELLAQVKPRVKGQVLYDPTRPYTLDVATTAAGLSEAVLTDKDLELNTIYDFRTKWKSAEEAYTWALATFTSRANRRQVALISSDSSAMRDYAVQQNMLTFSPGAEIAPEAWQDVLFHLEPGVAFYGDYAAHLLPRLSENAHYLVPAGDTANLSFLSGATKERRFFQYPGAVEPAAPRYLTLIFDCSDLDTAVNRMPALWQNPSRGALPLGWALPAALATAAPVVAHQYYADAYRSGTDQFVLGPSGAGFADLSRASAPDAFLHATRAAANALDAHAVLYQTEAAPDTFAPAVIQLASEAGLDGVFLLSKYDQPPAIYRGTPAITVPYVHSAEQAVTYLSRIPIDRRFAAICLDAATMTPEDAAHIAAHVASRYVVVPPTELMALMAAVARGDTAGEAAIKVASVEYPEGVISPDAPVPVKAEIEPRDQVVAASLIYRPAGSRLALDQPLAAAGDGFHADLPPLRWGGEVEARVRAVDADGHIAWSPVWTIKAARADTDRDGLSDAEEAYFLTDPDRPDTDGDGLVDGNDLRPLTFDWFPAGYFGPIYPPSDLPYLTNPGDSEVLEGGRVLKPGQRAHYWLPSSRVPAEAAVVVRVEGTGRAVMAVGTDPAAPAPGVPAEVTGVWEGAPLAGEALRNGVYLTVTCPAEATAPFTLYSVGLSSAAEAPSVTQVNRSPANPGPEQPITVSALAFDPQGVTEVSLTYRVNGKGQISMPMTAYGQRYAATIPALGSRDQLEYWVTARNTQGKRTVLPPETVYIGGRGREVVALLARRSFLGGFRPSPEWNGAASYAPQPGAADTAPANLTGGSYTVWVLVAGRGSGLAVSVDGKRLGAIDPNRPDGWQQVGRMRLDAGKHRVTLTAEAGNDGAVWTDPRYAAVLLSTDSALTPPVDQALDVVNAIALLSPNTTEPLTGEVELRATGAGNLTGLEFSVDGHLVKRVTGPPCSLTLSTGRYADGPHTLRLESVDRTGPTGLVLEVPITIAN